MSGNTHAALSNPTIFEPTFHPRRFLCNPKVSFRIVHNHKNSVHSGYNKCQLIQTSGQALASLSCKGSHLFHTSRVQLATVAVPFETKFSSHTCKNIKCMVSQGVRRRNEKRSYEAAQKSVENALSGLILADHTNLFG